MPFANNPAHRFTRRSVEAHTPGQIGVYGLYRPDVWVYVGRGDIRARLLDHLNGDNPCMIRESPTTWVGEVRADDEARKRELIRELTPRCNRQVG